MCRNQCGPTDTLAGTEAHFYEAVKLCMTRMLMRITFNAFLCTFVRLYSAHLIHPLFSSCWQSPRADARQLHVLF